MAAASSDTAARAARLSSVLRGLHKKGKLSARDVGDVAANSRQARGSDEGRLASARARGVISKHASRNSSRNLMRAFSPLLHPLYVVKTPMWNENTMTSVACDQAYLPPHEMLGAIIKPGDEAMWTDLGPGRAGINKDLQAWRARTHVRHDDDDKFACLSLWGDAAPHTHRDSIYLLLFSCVSGNVKRRFWITCLNKKNVQMWMRRQVFIRSHVQSNTMEY